MRLFVLLLTLCVLAVGHALTQSPLLTHTCSPLTAQASAFTYRPHVRQRNSVVYRQALQMAAISQAKPQELGGVASFFVASFWGADKPLKDGQARQLEREQERDLHDRYGPTTVPRKLESALILAKGKDSALQGCVGIEVSVCEGERVGLKTRGVGSNAVELRPVLSNLVVATSARRKGVGQQLVKACELKAKSWGYSEVLLLVNAENVRARKLYSKLGYTDLFIDKKGTTVEVTPVQIRNVPCTTVCMRKDLSAERRSPLDSLFAMFQR